MCLEHLEQYTTAPRRNKPRPVARVLKTLEQQVLPIRHDFTSLPRGWRLA